MSHKIFSGFKINICSLFIAAGIFSQAVFSAPAQQRFYSKALTTKYSDWFMVASHNTYYNTFKGKGADWHKVMDYTKAIEFDVWPGFGWKVFHNAVSETNCSDNLNGCLKTVRAWHDANPGHDPLTIFMEIKETRGFKVPDLNGILCGPTRGSKAAGRGDDDAIFACSELFRPLDLKGSYGSLRLAAQAGAWPTLDSLKGKIIFVINSGFASIGKKYLSETFLVKNPGTDRLEANAFVMAAAGSEAEILGVPQELSGYNHALADNVVFYNNECNSWNAKLGRLIRLNNYLSRGYYCDDNDKPSAFENKWIGTDMINFVAYDVIDYAYGQTTPAQVWNAGNPQGDFRGGAWARTVGVTFTGGISNVPDSWPNFVKAMPSATLAKALNEVDKNPLIKSFFILSSSGYCPEKSGWGKLQRARTACFYSEVPKVTPATNNVKGDLYIKQN